jgi:hypothetical protein
LHPERDLGGVKRSKKGSSDENLDLVSKTRKGKRKCSSKKANNDVGKQRIMWIDIPKRILT